MKEIKEDRNKWEDMQCPGVGTLNVIKMSTLCTVSYRCNAVAIRRGNGVKVTLFKSGFPLGVIC